MNKSNPSNKWYNIKTNRITKDGEFSPAHEADFLIELTPVIYGCDLVGKQVDNLNQ